MQGYVASLLTIKVFDEEIIRRTTVDNSNLRALYMNTETESNTTSKLRESRRLANFGDAYIDDLPM